MIDSPFQPQFGGTVSAATAAGAVNVTVPASAQSLLLTNVGTVLAFVRVKPDGLAADATVADMPLPAGASRVIGKGIGTTSVSIFASGAGSTVYVTPGEGWGGV